MSTILKWVLCIGLIFTDINIANSSGAKRVYIDKSTQTLTAYEGKRAVFISHVSTGKSKNPTPSGTFQVGVKERMHRSRLYNNAPMPFSVQFSSNYFIHGFSSVPNYPASHGCVRMPVGNAQKFYNWVIPGTLVTVVGGQNKSLKKQKQARKKNRASTHPHRI